MARVGHLEREALPAELRPLWDAFTTPDRDFTNQARVLALAPAAFRHLYGLVEDLRRESSLPPRLIEIAVVTTSRLAACPYCVGHHGPALVGLGLPAATVEAILEPDVPGLSAIELLVRDYARLVVERPWGIRDDLFARLKSHFDDREIVELTVRIGLCRLFNAVNLALEIPIEDGARAIAEQAAMGVVAPPGAEQTETRHVAEADE